MDNEIEEFLENLMINARAIDGKVVGGDMTSARLVLGKDERDAHIKDIADKYLRGEDINISDRAKALGVEYNDVVKELAEREIKKLLGK